MEYVFVHTSSFCNIYTVSIDEYSPPVLSKSFLRGLRQTDFNSFDSIKLFIRMYGTHYITSVVMGAKIGSGFFIKKNKLSELEGHGIDVSASLHSALFGGGGGGVSDNYANGTNVMRSVEETFTYSMGAPLPPNKMTGEWATNANLNPIPIRIRIVPLQNLPYLNKRDRLKLKRIITTYFYWIPYA
jgi:hypothetical protein